VGRTAVSWPFASRMASLFAASSVRISWRARVRSTVLTSWDASNADLADWAMACALRDMFFWSSGEEKQQRERAEELY
jgi:hypothetical protein